jgi:diguanylate cyclase (GGDEF)-like protein
MNPAVPIEWLDAIAAGIYLLFGLIHVDLWLRRRERRSHLWLASASVGALLVDLSGIVLRRGGADAGTVLPTLNLLGVLLASASILELVRSLTGGRATRLARVSYAALAGLALVIVYGPQHALVPVYMIGCGVLLLLAVVHAVRGARAGDPESRPITAGLLVLILTLLIDILGIARVIPAVPGLPILGFTTLFLVSARALSGRYEREYRELMALRNELEQRVHDRTHALEEANRMLAEMSRTDSLTGLANRRAFLEASERELHRAARTRQDCSVVMVDLDHFKQINDRHGHAAGDAILRTAASSLRSVLRGEDLVARWGGEEFILFLPNTDSRAALLVAEKARSTLAAVRHDVGDGSTGITGSFGVATHREARTLESTIAAADHALYRAKEAGRDRVIAEA